MWLVHVRCRRSVLEVVHERPEAGSAELKAKVMKLSHDFTGAAPSPHSAGGVDKEPGQGGGDWTQYQPPSAVLAAIAAKSQAEGALPPPRPLPRPPGTVATAAAVPAACVYAA
jgi:hypothetical protein